MNGAILFCKWWGFNFLRKWFLFADFILFFSWKYIIRTGVLQVWTELNSFIEVEQDSRTKYLILSRSPIMKSKRKLKFKHLWNDHPSGGRLWELRNFFRDCDKKLDSRCYKWGSIAKIEWNKTSNHAEWSSPQGVLDSRSSGKLFANYVYIWCPHGEVLIL